MRNKENTIKVNLSLYFWLHQELKVSQCLSVNIERE